MTTLIDGRYYRVQISAKNNKHFHFNENVDVDEIFWLQNADFKQSHGLCFTLYEATLMKTKLSLSSKAAYEEQEKSKP